MKKILNIIAQKPDKTGSGIYLQSLVKEADKKNYEQAVIAGVSAKDENVSFSSKQKVKFYPVVFETTELPFPVVGMSDVMPYESTKYKGLNMDMLERWKNSFSKAINKAVEEFKPDIIICHHLWILTAVVKEMYPHKKILAFCHGTDLRQLEAFKNTEDSFSKEICRYVTSNCKKIESVIVSHNFEKQLVISNYCINKDNVHIAGTGFNPDTFYMNENKSMLNKTKIIYAGKLSNSKGVPFLINSVKFLENSYDNIELYLAGSGAGEEGLNIMNMCKRRSGSCIIHCLGIVPQKRLAEFFRESDILVLPSFYEGLPLVLIEAMACGLKVVCTDLPGVREWMGDKINNSGIIEYVKLPRLKDIDTPIEEDICEFEKNLTLAIKKQIENKLIISEEFKKAINKKSWKSAFEDVEKFF